MPKVPIDPRTGLPADNRRPAHEIGYDFGTFRGNALKKQEGSSWNVPRTMEINSLSKPELHSRTTRKARKKHASKKKKKKNTLPKKKRTGKGRGKSLMASRRDGDDSEDEQIHALTAEIDLLKREREQLGIPAVLTKTGQVHAQMFGQQTNSFFPVHYEADGKIAPPSDDASDEDILRYLQQLKMEHGQNLSVLKELYTRPSIVAWANKQDVQSKKAKRKKKKRRAEAEAEAAAAAAAAAASDENEDADSDNDYVVTVRLDDTAAFDVQQAGGVKQRKKRGKSGQRQQQAALENVSGELLDKLNFKEVTTTQEFSFTKKAKVKSTTQKKIEDYKQAKAEEEAEFNKPYRAKPVPQSTMQPKYEEMVRQQRQRSQEIKAKSKELTKAMVRPFSFAASEQLQKRKEQKRAEKRAKAEAEKVEYVFQSRPVPWEVKVAMLDTMNKEAEAKRKVRVQQRAAALLKESRLPARMARGQRSKVQKEKVDAALAKRKKKTALQAQKERLAKQQKKLKKLEQQKIQVRRRKPKVADFEREHKFQPNLTSNQILDFDAAHKKFEGQLKAAKEKRKKTVVQPFKFREPVRKKKAKTAEESEQGESEQDKIKRQRQELYLKMKDEKPFYAPSTTKTKQAQALTKKTIEARRLEAEEKQNEDRKAHKDNRSLRKRMKPFFKETKSITEKQIRDNVKEFRKNTRDGELRYKEMLAAIKLTVSQRPLLIETDKQETDKIEARRKALLSIKDSLTKAGITDYKSYFDQDELEDIGLA